MSEVVLVGTDFSDGAHRAVDQARSLASALGLPLVVAHAWNTNALSGVPFSGSIPMESVMQAAREAAAVALEAEVARCRQDGLEVRGELVDGAASKRLVELAVAARARLIVLGRRGSAGLAHVLLGSVSERVARTASRPVLVVPEGEGRTALPGRMVVGVDFSSAAREATGFAVRLSEALGCAQRPLLVHAYQDERAEWLASWSEAGRPLQRAHDVDALDDWVRRLVPEAERIETLPVEGVVEERLVDVARERACDWIVVGLQGRTALASFLMGTTARRVLELADRPILVVPAQRAPEREAVD